MQLSQSCRFLGFEVTREKKYKLLFHNGSFKRKVLKYGTLQDLDLGFRVSGCQRLQGIPDMI